MKVHYSDGDLEELSLKQILSLLDIDDILNQEGEENDHLDALVGEAEDEMGHDDDNSSVGDDIDSNPDSKFTCTHGEHTSTATVLTTEQCDVNDVLKVQEVLLSYL